MEARAERDHRGGRLIPQAHIQAWRASAPWPNASQVEQDLIICRALFDLFNSSALAGKVTFRGGTAIHKLLFKRPLRYSEDIDLVQTQAEPIGPTVDAIREALACLGRCQREQAGHSMHLVLRFAPEAEPAATLKLKVEINTREHQSLFGLRRYPFEVQNDWYSGRAEAEERMLKKLTRSLTEDIEPLLPVGVRFDDSIAIEAFNTVWRHFIGRLRGDAWRLSAEVIAQLRPRYARLLP